MSKVRVRFAPSPTGLMHLGNARTALFNWLFARHEGGTFVLRVEDTDESRHVEESLRVIIDGLRWLGLCWDEGPGVGGPFGPYYQSERKQLYRQHAELLLERELAYTCVCPPESEDGCSCREQGVRQLADGAAVRLLNPGGRSCFDDVVKGRLEFENQVFGDFVLLKSDGTPTYNFANVVDDHHMRITHVIRGDDHVSNTPKQMMLYRAFGYESPTFAHLPQILGSDGKRLSKRHGAVALTEYEEQGFLPEGMVNYLALLGWSPKTEDEFLDPQQLVSRFDLSEVRPSAAMFSRDKLVSINFHHMERLHLDRRVEIVCRVLDSLGCDRRGPEWSLWLREIVDALGPRLKYGAQIMEYGDYFFTDDVTVPGELAFRLEPEGVVPAIGVLAARLETIEPWTDDAIESAVRTTASEYGLKAGSLIHAVRAAVSGKAAGPGLFTLVRLVGRDRAAARLKQAVDGM